MSTLEGLEGFWNALTGCSQRILGARAILYPMVNVKGSWKLLIVVSKVPCSFSVNFEACHID